MAVGVPGLPIGLCKRAGFRFLAPADQTVFTKSASNTVATTKPTEAFADGVSIGSTSGNPATLSYTPAAVDLDIDLTLTGGADTRKLAVADISNVSGTLTGWTATNVTVTSGKTDYAGGTTAYRVQSNSALSVQHHISTTPSPVNANNGTCLEFIAKPSSSAVKLYALFGTAAGNRQAIWDFTTGQCSSNIAYIYPVENLGNGWYRFWAGITDAQKATSVRIYLTNTFDILNAATVQLTTADYLDISGMRMVDGPLPFYGKQKSTFFRNGSTADGAERWNLYTEFNTSKAASGTAGMFLDVLKPDSYSSTKSYRYVIIPPVELNPAPIGTYNNELTIIKGLNLHNTMDCLFVRCNFITNRTWGGVKDDGTLDHDSYFSVMIPEFMSRMYSVVGGREGRTLMGYSAAGFAALTQLNRHPTVWGYCVAWDCPLSAPYAAYDQSIHFGTEAQYNAFNPKLHFDAAGWNDKPRLVFGGANTFITDTADMFAVLQSALGNPLNNDGTDYATTITDPDGKWWKLYKDTSSNGTGHNFLADWVSPAMAALSVLWSR